jgi:hypothetical protein
MITYKNKWDFNKVVLWRKFIILKACIRKEEKLEINELSNQCKVEKEQDKPKEHI